MIGGAGQFVTYGKSGSCPSTDSPWTLYSNDQIVHGAKEGYEMTSLACVMLYRKCTQCEYTEMVSRATARWHLKKLSHLKQLEILAARFSVAEGMQPDLYDISDEACLTRWKKAVREHFRENFDSHMRDTNRCLNSLGKAYMKGIVFPGMQDFNRAFPDHVTNFFIDVISPAETSFILGSSHERYLLYQHTDVMFLDKITQLTHLHSVNISPEAESRLLVHAQNCFREMLKARRHVIPSPVSPISFCHACLSQLYDVDKANVDEACNTCQSCRDKSEE